MKKNDSRIDLKDKSGWIGSSISLGLFILYAYLSFWVLEDYISIETGVCRGCPGPLKLLNDPLPFIFCIGFYVLTVLILFKYILKSEYLDSEWFKK